MRKSVLALLVVHAGLPRAVTAQQHIPSDSAILAVIRSRVDAKLAPGIVVGFLDPDGRRRFVTYGSSGTTRPLDANTVFEIGSISKTFTATVLADMVLRGEVNLDDPVSKYLPPAAKPPTRGGREITLLDLATHTSGLMRGPNNFGAVDLRDLYAGYDAAKLHAYLSSHTLRRDIGAEYEYSNVGYMTLSDIVTRRAGAAAFEDVVMPRVLEPLGMRDTRVTITPGMRARLAQGHDEGIYPTPPWNIGATLAGLGMLKSTANDMLTYLAANLDAERNPTRSRLSAAMHAAHRDQRAADTGRVALAWNRRTMANGDTLLYHGGGTGGYRSFAGFIPARGSAVIVLVNAAPLSYDLGFHLLSADQPLTPPARPAWAIGPTVPVAGSTLERYVGSYERMDGVRIRVHRTADTMFVTVGQTTRELLAASEESFFTRGLAVQYRFQRDSAGRFSTVTINTNGAESLARRVP